MVQVRKSISSVEKTTFSILSTFEIELDCALNETCLPTLLITMQYLQELSTSCFIKTA